MSFTFGSTTGFTLPTTSANTSAGGAGDATKTIQTKPLFGSTTTAAPPPFSFSTPAAAPAPISAFGASTTTSTAAQPQGFSLNLTSANASTSLPSFSLGSTAVGSSAVTPATTAPISITSIANATTSTVASVTTTAATGIAAVTSQPALSFGFPATSITASVASGIVAPSSTAISTTESALPGASSLTYSQLEDAINKWTIDLEEQEKLFINQAKQLNAWDRLLISNGEKVLQLNSNIEKVKQQQEQLDQELDFVLAQQTELENCIIPLEKELQDVPNQDTDRNETYQMAESLDSQLKQMSEDLKEVIEHLNESTKCQEMSDPIAQISRILSVHMDSLHWIDRNTAQISEQLDQISKMHEFTKHII